jgi:hypothetical protein
VDYVFILVGRHAHEFFKPTIKPGGKNKRKKRDEARVFLVNKKIRALLFSARK